MGFPLMMVGILSIVSIQGIWHEPSWLGKIQLILQFLGCSGFIFVFVFVGQIAINSDFTVFIGISIGIFVLWYSSRNKNVAVS